MRLRFWKKKVEIHNLGSVDVTVPAGRHKITYAINFDGINVDKTIVVTPTIREKK